MFQAFNREELSELGWGEIEEAGPTEEELIDFYYEYQYSVFTELYGLLEEAGGELVMGHYERFLLDKLYLGLYWDCLGLVLIYFDN